MAHPLFANVCAVIIESCPTKFNAYRSNEPQCHAYTQEGTDRSRRFNGTKLLVCTAQFIIQ